MPSLSLLRATGASLRTGLGRAASSSVRDGRRSIGRLAEADLEASSSGQSASRRGRPTSPGLKPRMMRCSVLT